ncbi:MBF complex negative regulatory component yox1 [Schizosaccharomyces pombe]
MSLSDSPSKSGNTGKDLISNNEAKNHEDEETHQKKRRRRTTDAEATLLEQYFLKTPKPSLIERQELSKKLKSSMTPRELQIWFQNKRQSLRRSNSLSRNRLEGTGENSLLRRKSTLTLCETSTGQAELFFQSWPLHSQSVVGEMIHHEQDDYNKENKQQKVVDTTKDISRGSNGNEDSAAHQELEECARSLVELQQQCNDH